MLPFCLPSLNVRDRQHFVERGRDKKALYLEILAAIGGSRHLPRPPFASARVSVVRHSAGTLDADNLYSSVKNLLDLLCPASATHPLGVGVLIDDAPKYCELVVTQQSAGRGAGMTTVRVQELEDV